MDIDTQITRRANLGRNRGFSVLELVITTTVIGIISAFAFLGVNSARSSTRLQTSVRQLASYMEKARLDAVRRHDYATVTFTSPQPMSSIWILIMVELLPIARIASSKAFKSPVQ